MPANLTPQYHKAEQVFKEARTAEEKISALEEMLAVIPKHKGTDHLQADLKRRLSRLRKESTRPRGKKSFDPFRVERGGAGQVLLLGAPNAGKSAIAAHLTNAAIQPTEFPFATQGPVPGMASFEDVQVQLVDLPPITADHFPAGMLGLVKASDGVLLVADLGADSVLEDLDAVLAALERGRVALKDPEVAAALQAEDGQPPEADAQADTDEEGRRVLRVELPAILVGAKADLPGAAERLEILRELYGDRLRPTPLSTVTQEGLDDLPARLFRMLDRIRVYSKEPGRPPDMGTPFVLKRGETVVDLAARIHRDFPQRLRQARVWGSARFDGQAVHRDYVLADRDVVELNVH